MTGGPAQVAPPGFRKGLELGQLKEYKSQWKCFRNGELVEDKQPVSSPNEAMEKYSVQFDDLFKIAWEEDAASKALQGVVFNNRLRMREPKKLAKKKLMCGKVLLRLQQS